MVDKKAAEIGVLIAGTVTAIIIGTASIVLGLYISQQLGTVSARTMRTSTNAMPFGGLAQIPQFQWLKMTSGTDKFLNDAGTAVLIAVVGGLVLAVGVFAYFFYEVSVIPPQQVRTRATWEVYAQQPIQQSSPQFL
jgi:hypothetical protein